MCGLVGVMGKQLGLGDIKKFKDLMTLAQLRGEDGAGVMTVPDPKGQDFKVRYGKTTWSSGHLITTKEFYDTIKDDVHIVAGHARAPTKGGTDIKSVHPHRSEHIYLMHNGTMHYVGGNTVKDTESDSKLVAKCIADRGIEYFVQESFGAYCLVWIDLKDNTLNFLRNEDRPLTLGFEHFTQMAGSQVSQLWWASEMWMIPTVLSRYHGYNKERYEFKSLPKNEHWSYPLETGFSLKDPTIVTRERKTKTSYPSIYTGYYEGWEDADQDPVIPFDVTARNKKNDSNGLPRSSTPINGSTNGTTRANNTNGFSYIPPEHRGGSGTNSSATDAFISPAKILSDSKLIADIATKKAKDKEAGSNQSTFPVQATDKARFMEFRCKHRVEAMDRISAGSCVWCSLRPTIIAGQEIEIYPVRYTERKQDYVCAECITDLDVQRMVGIT